MTRTVAGNRCGTPRPGRRASSRREGDWHCQSCGNINYNSRLMCNQCGIQKPEGLGEPREGRAGGFDERQTADDYKAPASADDDDDGFDDFGRKKSKKKLDKANRRKKEVHNNAPRLLQNDQQVGSRHHLPDDDEPDYAYGSRSPPPDSRRRRHHRSRSRSRD
mmetsp:Transcript_29095/g.93846  ORF Transcript_29095/g.93846 Transcript_29095/m.93846 type:complete len:163 (-) Transcript_29095:21-509(-)